MGSTVVQAESGREPDASVKTVSFNKRPCAVLDHIGNVSHSHPGLDPLLRMLPHNSVGLCSFPNVVISRLRVFVSDSFEVPLLL